VTGVQTCALPILFAETFSLERKSRGWNNNGADKLAQM
jgi:hypothetical protein